MFNETAYLHPREELLQAMERIYRYHMTTTSGGNLSLREPNGTVWITPARVDKGSLPPRGHCLRFAQWQNSRGHASRHRS